MTTSGKKKRKPLLTQPLPQGGGRGARWLTQNRTRNLKARIRQQMSGPCQVLVNKNLKLFRDIETIIYLCTKNRIAHD